MPGFRLVLVLAIGFALSGCWDQKTGPEAIHYDREACEICRMIISDPRFAAEIRGGPRHKLHKFDDIGDAIHWLKGQSWKDDPDVEIWVKSMKDGKTWLDARKAWYLPDQISPMDYNYGAVAKRQEKSLNWTQMKKAVIKHGLSSRCTSPDSHSGPEPDPKNNTAGSEQ